ncbi:STY4528 family pathogenicity island replication protein [Sedimenticola selenatireducens]|uniref:STY4528 family pathogenicity island replication protein n=1 Tax=Sedimenticola selenatireducens TaxID=191960 RepID=UPI0004B41238|nr:STY4528 family pathogenicity island replication protein [Sedimenticola selenatireducens]
MAEGPRGLRPETHALDALIQATIDRAQQAPGSLHTDTMLFMGNRHQAFPTLVVQDPVLEPVDKLVWMVILLQAHEMGNTTAFPSYEYLARKTNVASTSTISRAIAILRATRWLTLCARLRATSGRFGGNVYALHDEPLPLADALHLDPDYMNFLRQSLTHHHARVRLVARGVLDTIDEDIHEGIDICAVQHPLDRRVQAVEVIQRDLPRRYFAFSAKVMGRLRNGVVEKDPDHQDQNSKTDENRPQNLYPQKSKAGSCSSSYINTTTTETTEATKIFSHADTEAALIYPRRLSENQRALADRYLNTVPADVRQSILDELEGRLRSEQKGMRPLYDELRFLHALCRAAKQGEFIPNLGIKVHDERIARALERSRRQIQEAPGPEDAANRHNTLAAGQKRLDAIRRSLKMPTLADRDSKPR